MMFWQVFAALLCVAYCRNHGYKKSANCGRGFKQLGEVCLKTYHYATDYGTAKRKCRHQGSHLIRGTIKSLKKMVKNMQSKKMIENTKYWTSSYDLDENSVWFHRFDPKDFAMVMTIDGKDLEERVESRSMLYRFICQKYLSHSKSKSKEQKDSFHKDQDIVEQEKMQHEQANTVIEIKEILSEGEIINELGLIDDEPSKLTDSEASERSSLESSEASDLSSQQSSEESDLSSEASDLSSQQSSEASDLSSLESSEESDLSSEASDLSSQQSSEENDLSSQNSSEETKINSEQGLKELEDEPEGRLSEEQWGEQIPDEHGAEIDEQGLEDDKPERWHEELITDNHGTKETDENSSPTPISTASFILPLSFILLCFVT